MMSENITSSPPPPPSPSPPPPASLTTKIPPLPMAEIESSVSKLLLTTKKLLETLTAWTSKQINDEVVYEEYNTLKSHFASATSAFESALLPMDDMLHLPDDLIHCLKDALSKEQSPTTLQEYLPLIRDIILKLLEGLKRKQVLLREQQQKNNSNIIPLPSPSSSTETSSRLSSSRPLVMVMNETVVEESPLSTSTNATFNSTSHPAIPLFLKFNDRIKRTMIDDLSNITDVNTIKSLFAEKFALKNDDSNMYTLLIVDSESSVEYELEDLADIQPYTILSIKSQKQDAHCKQVSEEELNDEMKSLFKETMHQVLQSINQQKEVSSTNKMKNELNQLKQDLADMNQIYTHFKSETEAIIKELNEKSNKTRDEMNKDKEMTQKISAIIINRLEEVQDKIDQIKLDVTQKRCRPSKIQLTWCQQESKQLETELNHLSTKLKTIKPIWKRTWETQLQQIVKEQQFFKEQELLLVDLKEDYENVIQVLNQLYKIFEINERKKKNNRTTFNKREEDDQDGMSSVIKQVATIEVNHTKRLEALSQAEQRRSKELSSRIDAFERELTNFVGLNKLKSVPGGPKAIDQKRQEKDQTLIKQFFVQQQQQQQQRQDDDDVMSSSSPVPNLELEKNASFLASTSSKIEVTSNSPMPSRADDDGKEEEEELAALEDLYERNTADTVTTTVDSDMVTEEEDHEKDISLLTPTT